MSSKSSQKAVYLRAQAAVLRSSGVPVGETAKTLQKSKSWVAKSSTSSRWEIFFYSDECYRERFTICPWLHAEQYLRLERAPFH